VLGLGLDPGADVLGGQMSCVRPAHPASSSTIPTNNNDNELGLSFNASLSVFDSRSRVRWADGRDRTGPGRASGGKWRIIGTRSRSINPRIKSGKLGATKPITDERPPEAGLIIMAFVASTSTSMRGHYSAAQVEGINAGRNVAGSVDAGVSL